MNKELNWNIGSIFSAAQRYLALNLADDPDGDGEDDQDHDGRDEDEEDRLHGEGEEEGLEGEAALLVGYPQAWRRMQHSISSRSYKALWSGFIFSTAGIIRQL